MSNNNKRIRIINDKMQVELLVNSFPAPKEKKKFTVHYNIDFDSNEFFVEFLDSAQNYLTFVPIQRFEDCKQFTLNKGIQLYKSCGICRNYHYSSSNLSFNYKTGVLDPFIVKFENAVLSKNTDSVIRRYELTNNYLTKRSTLLFDSAGMGTGIKPENLIEVPLIKFLEPKLLMDKLDTIIVFS